MINHQQPKLISSKRDLTSLCKKLKDSPVVAVDTEFVRDRSYYPKLGLVQIATPELIACIDPLAVDLAPLYDILHSPDIEKIIHAARQDLEVLHLETDQVLSPLFDTQLAAAFIGMDRQVSYAGLVKLFCDKALKKSETQTPWLDRPLSDKQVYYAADDVRYLLHIHNLLQKRLKNARRLDWFNEESEKLFGTSSWDNDPNQAWQRIRGRGRLDIRSQTVLVELAAWREHEAKKQDKPRTWVINDGALLWLAENQPTAVDQLEDLRAAEARKKYGEQLIKVIEDANKNVNKDSTTPKRGLSKDEREIVRDLQTLVAERAKGLNVDNTLLATRSDVTSFVRNPAENPLTEGWRKEAIGDYLISIATAA
ncbi:MAG: ribonuclease D [Gammaproteobacteria bacterium]|nr:ribonuclease D [Gammaproteobacteria bacterium]